MRSRLIRPDFFSDDKLAECGPFGLHLYLGLMCLADRDGRLEDRPMKIKVQVVPYFDCNVEEVLEALALAKLIIRYQIAGRKLIEIVEFAKYQQVYTKEKSEGYPAPSEIDSSLVEAPPKLSESLEKAPKELLYRNRNRNKDSNRNTTKGESEGEQKKLKPIAPPDRHPRDSQGFVLLSDDEFEKLRRKYGDDQALNGIRLLSDWIGKKKGQGHWFYKTYSGAFNYLNPSSCFVWREIEPALRSNSSGGLFNSAVQTQNMIDKVIQEEEAKYHGQA